MADQFRSSFDEMARESELDELRKEIEVLRHNNPLTQAQDETQPRHHAAGRRPGRSGRSRKPCRTPDAAAIEAEPMAPRRRRP